MKDTGTRIRKEQKCKRELARLAFPSGAWERETAELENKGPNRKNGKTISSEIGLAARVW
jgi:hypothetical protein